MPTFHRTWTNLGAPICLPGLSRARADPQVRDPVTAPIDTEQSPRAARGVAPAPARRPLRSG